MWLTVDLNSPFFSFVEGTDGDGKQVNHFVSERFGGVTWKVYLCHMIVPLHVCLDQRIPVGTAEGKTVHVVVASVDALLADEGLQAECLPMFSPVRRAKVEAYKHPRSRCLSIGVGLLLDRLLAEVGLRERDMDYVEGEHGKPSLVGFPDIAFNLSHSGSMVAAAMTVGTEHIGIDIQRIARYRPELVRRVFSDADRAKLAALATDAERERLFTRLWCRAEAYAKATGAGLQWPFCDPPSEAVFHEFDVDADYCCVMCTITRSTSLTYNQ